MNFTCPYCGRHSTITDPDWGSFWNHINMNKSVKGEIGFGVGTIRCPNKECHQLVLRARLTGARWSVGEWKETEELQAWKLLPESSAKVMPDYVPAAIRSDYYEACRIKDLSPKSSAALARRCLQGMIRDFWGVSKARLKDEIEEIKDKVDTETWEAIDAIRSVGNIGAHMEKDVNIIVDIEPDEAQMLIGLIENLVDDWYVVRHDRQQRKQSVKAMAAEKEVAKKHQTN